MQYGTGLLSAISNYLQASKGSFVVTRQPSLLHPGFTGSIDDKKLASMMKGHQLMLPSSVDASHHASADAPVASADVL